MLDSIESLSSRLHARPRVEKNGLTQILYVVRFHSRRVLQRFNLRFLRFLDSSQRRHCFLGSLGIRRCQFFVKPSIFVLGHSDETQSWHIKDDWNTVVSDFRQRERPAGNVDAPGESPINGARAYLLDGAA